MTRKEPFGLERSGLQTMQIVSDHGFPKGSMPDDEAFDRFKNERDYIARSGKMKTTVAAMDWAAAEIERLRRTAGETGD